MSYKSPIEVINEVSKKIETDFENNVMKAVFSCSINVDKDELIKALKYDRDQYDKGFEDGRKETAKEILQSLYDHCFELVDPYDNDCEESFGSIDPCYILNFAEIYGVEVEE